MNLPPTKYIAAGICGFAFILLWNALLIFRDNQMFKAYETKHQQYCEQLKVWHPDCKIE